MAIPTLPKPLHLVNEGLAFLLELAALGILSWWGFSTGHGLLLHLVLGLGAPAAAITVWTLFAAPKARFQLAMPFVLLVKAVVFGSAALAYGSLGHQGPALAFAVVALVNTALAAVDREALTTASRATS
jgi:hypothetical protein